MKYSKVKNEAEYVDANKCDYEGRRQPEDRSVPLKVS